jgi:tRNA (cytidine/uridine-2'-O-)-methyltransferase
MRIALYQPEIAGNVGAVLRLAACFGVPVDIIEPTGFAFSDTKMRRAGMDYMDQVEMVRHENWDAFQTENRRQIILLTTKGGVSLYNHAFTPNDTLLMGSESAGVPSTILPFCAQRVRIPLVDGVRSLNLAVATGIAISEALRQTRTWPE